MTVKELGSAIDTYICLLTHILSIGSVLKIQKRSIFLPGRLKARLYGVLILIKALDGAEAWTLRLQEVQYLEAYSIQTVWACLLYAKK